MGLEWTTLKYIEDAPLSVRAATFLIALLILAILEKRDWLKFKGRSLFNVAISLSVAAYLGVCGFAYWDISPSKASVAKVTKESAEDDRDTVVRHLVTALSERDIARRDLAATKRDLEAARSHQPQPQPPQPVVPESERPVLWYPDLGVWTGGDQTGPQFLGLAFRGKANDLVEIIEASVISEITGEKKILQVSLAPGPQLAPISELNQIPKDAPVELWAIFTPPLRATDMLSQWGKFRFHVDYQGGTYDKVFDQKYMTSFLGQFPGSNIGPHITKKATAK